MTERKFYSRSVDLVDDAAMVHERDTSLQRLFPEASDDTQGVAPGERKPRTPETDPHIRALGERIAVGRSRFQELTGKQRRSRGETMSELADVADARAARDELVQMYTGLVSAIARKYAHRGIEWNDLIQDGAYALLKAAERFDPDNGEFKAYAGTAIEGNMKRITSRESELVPPPRDIVDNRPLVIRTAQSLEMRDGYSPSDTELAEEVALRMLAKDSEEDPTDEAVAEKAKELLLDMPLLRRKSKPLSFDAPLSDEDNHTLQDKIVNPQDAFALATDLTVLRDALQTDLLDNREKRILYLRYWGEKTQAAIADEFGVSQMHISRLLRKAQDKLRGVLDEEV